MRILTAFLMCFLTTSVFAADDIRLAVMDFEDLTSPGEPGKQSTFAQKGALLLTEQLVGHNNIIIVDRRDFLQKMGTTSQPDDKTAPMRPSFINAAQLLRVDAVLSGSLMSISAGKRTVNAGAGEDGVDFETVTVRVMVQALDAIDGTVLAAEQGKEVTELRQSKIERTALSDEQMLTMLEEALAQASKKLLEALPKTLQAKAERKRVNISVTSTDDPALVEIDGVLVGSTPMQALQAYKGDHILTVSRPNYTTVTKRLVLDADVSISVPMFRNDLTVEERKEIYKSTEMKMYIMDGRPDVLIQSLQ